MQTMMTACFSDDELGNDELEESWSSRKEWSNNGSFPSIIYSVAFNCINHLRSINTKNCLQLVKESWSREKLCQVKRAWQSIWCTGHSFYVQAEYDWEGIRSMHNCPSIHLCVHSSIHHIFYKWLRCHLIECFCLQKISLLVLSANRHLDITIKPTFSVGTYPPPSLAMA